MKFRDQEFQDLVSPFLTGIGNLQIADYLRDASRKVIGKQSFFRQNFLQGGVTITYDGTGRFSSSTATADDGRDIDKRLFFGVHEGYDFGRLIRFWDMEERRQICPNTGEPDFYFDTNPNRTTICCEFFYKENAGGYIKTPVCECALTITSDAIEIPDKIFYDHRELLQAAAMERLMDFHSKTVRLRDWHAEYIQKSNWALERYSPNFYEGPPITTLISPPGGGVDISRGGAFFNNYVINRRG